MPITTSVNPWCASAGLSNAFRPKDLAYLIRNKTELHAVTLDGEECDFYKAVLPRGNIRKNISESNYKCVISDNAIQILDIIKDTSMVAVLSNLERIICRPPPPRFGLRLPVSLIFCFHKNLNRLLYLERLVPNGYNFVQEISEHTLVTYL